MAKLQVTNGVAIRLIWAVGGSPWAINVLGARNDGAVTVNQALADSLGAGIKAAFSAATALNTHIGANVSLQKVGVRNLHIVEQKEYLDAGAAAPGTSVGKTLPWTIAFCVTLRTAEVGKANRGRVYLFGFDESSSDGNSANADTTADSVAFVNGCKNAISAAGMQMAILHRALPQRETEAGETLPARVSGTVPVTTVEVVDSIWDVQRRRKS